MFFPVITKIHTTGSRAEKLWIPYHSDVDIIYEIGPGLVYPKTLPESQIDDGFFWEEAEHIGYYRVSDSKGGYIYPQDLQMKLAPTFQYLNSNQNLPRYNNQIKGRYKIQDTRQEKTEAAVNLNDSHDHVIGLKLDKWPHSIKQQFTSKLKSVPLDVQQILGK